jgi:nicotinate phosphoribosyltransferase
VPTAVRTAVELAGSALGAVRIDSGDVAEVARGVRAQLDSLGAERTKIVVTGDLDEYAIGALADTGAPVDGFGVGTALVTGSGAPTSALVYKLVARSAEVSGSRELVPVAKRSVGKPTIGGRKWAARDLGDADQATAEIVSLTPFGEDSRARPLLRELVRNGEITGVEPLGDARRRHQRALAELPPEARNLEPGGPAIPTTFTTYPKSGIDS